MVEANINNIAGKRINSIFVEGERKPKKISAAAPPRNHLANYYAGDWLILDNYGNDLIPDEIEKRFSARDYTLAINKKTGILCKCQAIKADNAFQIWLTPVIDTTCGFTNNVTLPNSYLKRINELVNKKRPFRFGFKDFALMLFHIRESSYTNLFECLTVTFRFNDCSIEWSMGEWTRITKI